MNYGYYIHTDHLGSYCAQAETNPPLRFSEIGNNMNGRLYDPVIGRFFSPDTYVQNPFFTQNFNRYSYALNNPLKYVDRTGQWYEDYDDYDEDGGKPKKGQCDCPHDGNYSHVYGYVGGDNVYIADTDPSDDHPENNLDMHNDPANWFEPFDYEGQSGPGDPPTPPNPRRGAGISKQGAQMMANLYWHYQFGGGQSIMLDATKFNFSHTSRQQLGIPENPTVGHPYPVNLFNQGINALSLSFGNVYMVYHGNDQFSIMRDKFDFDYQPNASFSRNAATLVGSLFFGNIYQYVPASPLIQPNVFFGGPFDIYFWGRVTIK